MSFCENCGAAVNKDSETKYTCGKCGSSFYVNPKGATSLFLLKQDGTVLLGVRAKDPHKGKLDCIGGFVDVGENFEICMYRELEEETGLGASDISELSYLGSTYDPYPWEGRDVHTVSVYFTAWLKEGAKMEASDDIEEIRSVNLDEVKKEDVAWEGLWEMIGKLKKQLARKDRPSDQSPNQ